MIIIFPLLVTNIVSNSLKIHYEFQPLYKDNKPGNIELHPLEGVISNYLDIGLLKYDALIFNNVVSVIGGDKRDTEHELELSLKIKDSKEVPVEYAVQKKIFTESYTRERIISLVNQIEYVTNITLKPEALDTSTIVLNKDVRGVVVIDIVLDCRSLIYIFLSLLILEGVIIQTLESLVRFSKWEY